MKPNLRVGGCPDPLQHHLTTVGNNCIRGGFTCLGYENKRNVNDKTPTSGKVSNILPRQQDERQYGNESPTGR